MTLGCDGYIIALQMLVDNAFEKLYHQVSCVGRVQRIKELILLSGPAGSATGSMYLSPLLFVSHTI